LKFLAPEEIVELIKEIPELELLNQPSPFDKNKVIAMIDENGHEIKEDDIMDLIQMNKMMQQRYGSHRNLQGVEVATVIGETVVGHVVEKVATGASKVVISVLKKIDPIMWRIKNAWDEMNDYDEVNGAIKDAQAATDSEFTKNTLHDADELKYKAQKNLYTSYRWLKTSARLLYKLLQRVEIQIKIRDMKESKINKYFDTLAEVNEMKEADVEAQQDDLMKLNEELMNLYDEIWKTEE